MANCQVMHVLIMAYFFVVPETFPGVQLKTYKTTECALAMLPVLYSWARARQLRSIGVPLSVSPNHLGNSLPATHFLCLYSGKCWMADGIFPKCKTCWVLPVFHIITLNERY